MGRARLSSGNGVGHFVRRVAHRSHHGITNNPAYSHAGLLRRNRRSHYVVHCYLVWCSGLDHTHDYRRDRRSRRSTKKFCRTLGCGQQYCRCVGAHVASSGFNCGGSLRIGGFISVKREAGDPLTQVAALPIRRDDCGQTRVLLITSRETRRWIIPKGWPMKGRTNAQAAAQEALEEAGVEGRVQKEPVGKYLYWKRAETNFALCEVLVYLLDVRRQLDTWPEWGQREARWFSVEDAADLVDEPGLTAIIASLAPHIS